MCRWKLFRSFLVFTLRVIASPLTLDFYSVPIKCVDSFEANIVNESEGRLIVRTLDSAVFEHSFL